MYALLLLTSTLSVYYFLKKNRWGFILATTAALYTHHFSIFVVIWEGIWRLKENWGKPIREIVKAFSDFFIIGLLYLPWFYPLYYQTSLVGSGFWLGKPTWQTFAEIIGKFSVGGKDNFQRLALGAIVITLFIRRWSKDKKNSAFLLGWFFAPLILTFLISQFFQPIFFDRYMLMVIPASSVLISSARRKPSLIFILAAIFLLATINYHYFTHPTKRPFRELAEYVKSEAAELTLVNHNAAAHHLWESEYYGLEAPIYAPEPLPFYTGTALMEKGDIIQSLPETEEIGLITSAPVEEVKIPGYHISEIKRFRTLSFLWMEKD